MRLFRWLIPFRSYTIDTAFSPTEVANELRRYVAKPDGIFDQVGPWRGTVSERGFRFRRTIGYRNSFLPLVSGTIAPTPFGSRLSVRMTMHWWAMIFIASWLGMSLFITVAAGVRSGSMVPHELLMVGFVFVMANGGFGYEAGKAERLLEELLPRHEGPATRGAYR
ncbi:MAG: hypothetical protein R3B72_17900 [Polyangiaceae bacterium]